MHVDEHFQLGVPHPLSDRLQGFSGVLLPLPGFFFGLAELLAHPGECLVKLTNIYGCIDSLELNSTPLVGFFINEQIAAHVFLTGFALVNHVVQVAVFFVALTLKVLRIPHQGLVHL